MAGKERAVVDLVVKPHLKLQLLVFLSSFYDLWLIVKMYMHFSWMSLSLPASPGLGESITS